MAVAGVVATQLTDHSTRTKTLTVGGVDVILSPGGNALGTPIDSIRVSEKGPGAVSTMSFVVEDPALVFFIADGMEVHYWDVTNNVPIFTGWLEHWTAQPWGGTGVSYDIAAIGAESLLDWAVLAVDLPLAAGLSVTDAILSIVANCYGTGPLRAFSSGIGTGNQAQPIPLMSTTLLGALTVTAGTTLREAIRQTIAFAGISVNSGGAFNPHVDFWYGLRILQITGTGNNMDDYFAQLSILDQPTLSPAVAAGLQYDTEASTVRAVYVKGLNAAGTGFVTDGSGLIGATAYINDQTVDTAAKLASVGGSYLASYASKVRGSLTLEDIQPGNGVFTSGVRTTHPGTVLRITDVQTGLNGAVTPYWPLSQIDKTFNSNGKENWTFWFGGQAPSGAALLRRLTLTARA